MNANDYYCRKLSEKDDKILSLTNEIQKLKNNSISEDERRKYYQKLRLQKFYYDRDLKSLQQQYLKFVKELTETRKELYNSFEINKKLEQKIGLKEVLIEKLKNTINIQCIENIPLATEIDIKIADIKPPEPLTLPPLN